MATTFPKNPADGTIFEAIPGLFYQFSAKENCWIRVDGLDALGLATPTKDGLMSPDDFNKLNGLLIPPPQSTIKGEDCKITYAHGQVALTSTDESLSVLPTLQLTNNSGDAGVIDQPWAIHQNTVGYDFRLDVEKMLAAMKANGNFTQVKIQGRQGAKGKPGKDGIDKLETGPQGPDGPDGKNSPFDGAIGSDTNSYVLADDSSNRAIVDIIADTTDGKFLIATRANIGNPNACPNEIQPKAIDSPLALVLSKQENAMVRTLQSTNDCVNPCTVCVSTLHYVNLQLILDAFFERYQELVIQLKQQKEALAVLWLRTLINVFNDQKFALCCALENCKSAQRNKQERQYLESQRIQASQADQQLTIDGVNDRNTVNMDADKSCLVDSPTDFSRGVGCDCILEYTLNGKLHATDPRGLFLEKPPAIVNFSTSTPLQTDRIGILDVHSEIQRTIVPGVPNNGESLRATRTIIVQTDIVPPPQTPYVSDQSGWELHIGNFSAASSPARPTLSQVTILATMLQNGNTVASYIYSVGSGDILPQTITLLQNDGNFGLADLTIPIELIIETFTGTTFQKDENAVFYATDYTLGSVHLIGHSNVVNVDISLQSDWGVDNWTCDGVGANTGQGFVALTLPPGDYVAQITDCCVDVINTRHLWRGVAAIEYNAVKEVTGVGGTVAPNANFSERVVAMFPDMGSFNNNTDARFSYLGNTIEFSHQGGQIKSWIVDPDSVPSNNDGQMIICIHLKECEKHSGSGSGSAPDTNALFVYRGAINPLSLLGVIEPYNGNLTAAQNYGYNEITADASNIHFGPSRSPLKMKSFFYHGTDGLSFFTINGGTNVEASTIIKMALAVSGNSVETNLRVADDSFEVTELNPEDYRAVWTLGTFGSDGLAIGPFDPPADGAGWAITIAPDDLGSLISWEVISSDGNVFSIFSDTNGIGQSHKNDAIIITPVRSGCVMPFKQIQWLERGHRIGAACSCVVTIDSQKYIIVKRSIGTDVSCGGGESAVNPCIASYLSIGAGHPAIAWPTINGEEFVGIPTSGGHGFVLDQVFSEKVLAEIAAGHMTNIHGDPKGSIPFVILPTAI